MKKLLQEYAKLAVNTGVNIQKGQLLIINCPVIHYEFGRMCAKAAYESGAEEVIVDYNDSYLTKLNYENVDTEILKNIPKWLTDKRADVISRKCAFLHIISEVPGLLKDIDSSKIQTVQMEMIKAFEPFRSYTMNNEGQWSIVGLPNADWAKKVYPELEEKEAIEKLLEAILYVSRVEIDKSQENWNKHNENTAKVRDTLNDYHFEALHFENSLGTDLILELNKNHIWAGGCDHTQNGVMFNPNIPTEEVFSMPKRSGVNGKVVATMPLNHQGKLIEDFTLDFKDGKVVEYTAKKEIDALKNILAIDENASYLGEVALISNNSPISNLNVLFYNTLYDENASCHLALGSAYPSNMKNGTTMSKEELLANECNVSMTHVDFMFGSPCMKIHGITTDGQRILIMKDGDLII